MRGGLVGDRVRPHAAPYEFGKHVRRIAEQSDRDRFSGALRVIDHGKRLIESRGLFVEIARAQPHLDARRLAFDREAGHAGHHRGERLRAAHAAEARRQNPAPGEIAAKMLATHFGKGLVGALNDALATDIDPRAGRHLAVHHEALAIERVEMVPGRPVRHQIGIGDQHARRVGMGAEDADGFAGLHEQCLVIFETLQRRDDAVKAFPVACGAADAAVDDKFARPLRDIGVEVVHQHAHRRFGQPALRRNIRSVRRADDAGIVQTMRAHYDVL